MIAAVQKRMETLIATRNDPIAEVAHAIGAALRQDDVWATAAAVADHYRHWNADNVLNPRHDAQLHPLSDA